MLLPLAGYRHGYPRSYGVCWEYLPPDHQNPNLIEWEELTLKSDAEATIARLTAELEAAQNWQPIETVPKHRLIDIWLKDGVRWCDCYHDRITDTWRTSRPSGHLLTIQSRFVSHWMDRPTPPADLGKGAV